MRPDIAALVGSRICHDLISPIGAIGNGVELISLTETSQSPEIALISESVENANARIRFFRVAFGACSPTQTIGRSDILSILSASAKSGRFEYDWQLQGDQPRNEVRIAFLLLQCFETALPAGGDVTIGNDDKTWTLVAKGARLQFDAALWESITKPRLGYTHTAAQVQFALLPEVLRESHREIAISCNEEQIKVKFA